MELMQVLVLMPVQVLLAQMGAPIRAQAESQSLVADQPLLSQAHSGEAQTSDSRFSIRDPRELPRFHPRAVSLKSFCA